MERSEHKLQSRIYLERKREISEGRAKRGISETRGCSVARKGLLAMTLRGANRGISEEKQVLSSTVILSDPRALLHKAAAGGVEGSKKRFLESLPPSLKLWRT